MSNIQGTVTSTQGTTIVLKTTPTVGILSLLSFTDDSVVSNEEAFFTKTFRYTLDGINYSSWQPLTTANLTAIEFDAKSVFIAELAYGKNESSGDTSLEITSVTLEATIEEPSNEANEAFNSSIFNGFFSVNDAEVMSWYINVLEKVYNKGVLANFVSRKDRQGSDADFIAFWSGIAKYFAYYVKLARVFSRFYESTVLIEDFLTQRGLVLSSSNSLEDLSYLLEHFYEQIAARGTPAILQLKSDSVNVDGELIRLLQLTHTEELIFCFFDKVKFGWTIDRSSPSYRGMRKNFNINKLPWSLNSTVTNQDILPYTLGNCSIEDDALKIIDIGSVNVTDPITVDSRLDYQFSFLVKIDEGKTLTFNLLGYNSGSSVNNYSRQSGNVTNNFFVEALLTRGDKFFEVRCVLFNSARGGFGGDTTNLRQGHNILMNSACNEIVFQILTEGEGITLLKDFQMKPLMTTRSRGFIDSTNHIALWAHNNNQQQSLKQIVNYAERYLLPLDFKLRIENIGDDIYTDPEQYPDTTYWLGSGTYCRKVVWQGIDPSCEIQTTMWVPDESSAYCEQ